VAVLLTGIAGDFLIAVIKGGVPFIGVLTIYDNSLPLFLL
jgi:hypothetical protein